MELQSAVLSLKIHLGSALFICGGDLDGEPCICVYVKNFEYAEKMLPSYWKGFPIKICLNQ